jgi:hypothetical protein
MSKRFDNKRILYILAGLIILLALTILVKIPKEKATIRENLVEIDTAKVSRIIISPRIKEGAPFEFTRTNGRWTIRQENLEAQPEKDAVQNILSEVMNVRPKNLEAVDKSKWNEFNLTDSLAIRVQFLDEKGKTMTDLMIGRFTYSQTNNPYASPGGSGIQGTSFVRLHDDKRVYGVEGFLALSFSGKFNDYRNKSFIKANKEDITKISFIFPADSGFVLSRKDSVWYASGQITDSLAIANYINTLLYINGQEIKDNYKPVQNPDYEMRIEGNNLLNITVKCFKAGGENEFILTSSLNPDVYFTSKKDGIFDRLFKGEKYFTTKTAKKAR